MTWSGGRGYSTDYNRSRDRYRGLVQQIRLYDEKYYESHVRTEDANGNPIKPVEQVVFTESKANVPVKSVTTAGVKSKTEQGKGGAVFLDANRNEVRLDDYLGKPVVLVFTRGFPGYICPMCTTYTAQITVAHQKFKDAGAEVLIVFPGEASQVDEFIDACQQIAETDEVLPFPILIDPDLAAVKAFNIRADLSLPATYIFDKNGDIAWGFVGEQPHQRPSVAVLLEEVKKLK